MTIEWEVETTEEALDRKACENLAEKVQAFESNRMTLNELKAYASGLWDITSGLISEQVNDVVLATYEYLQGAKPFLNSKVVMVAKGKTAVIKWDDSKVSFVVFSSELKVLKKSQKEFESDSAAACNFATAVRDKFITQGFKEI